MAVEPLTVTLSTFDKLEILRTELKTRQEDLTQVERRLKKALRSLGAYRYLKTISPYYAAQPTPDEAAKVPELEKWRQALTDAISTITSEIPKLEAAVAGGGGAPAPKEVRRNRFM